MNKLKIILILLMVMLTSGCTKAFILMKSVPITPQNAENYEQRFKTGQRIYYAIIKQKDFKDDVIRVQIMKKNDKIETLGYSIVWAKDIEIDPSKRYYSNYFTISKGGLYLMRIFELRRTDKALAAYDFWVSE